MVLAKQAFAVSLVLIFVSLAIGVFTFYKYSIQADEKEIEFIKKSLWLEENILQEILTELKEREIRFKEVDSEEYPSLFDERLIEEEEEELTE